MQVAVLRLLGSLFQVLDPIYDKLCVLNLNLQKVIVTTTRGYTIIVSRMDNFVKIVRTLIVIKFKNI